MPTSVDSVVLTPVECSKTIIRNTKMDAKSAKTLAEKINDHMRYKLVNLRVEKALNFFTGSTQPSKDDIAKFTRNRGWHDVARIVDKVSASWKPASTSETRRSTRNTPVEDPSEALPHRGMSMFFCKSTLTVCNISKVSQFLADQHWPFLQVQERIAFTNGTFGRGVITTTKVNESEILCDYHTDVIISQRVLSRRENTQYILDCGDIVFDATLETCDCHPGRRTFGRLLNYRPSNHAQCNVRARRLVLNGKDVILFIAKRRIDALEELCFDYIDPKCRTEFQQPLLQRPALSVGPSQPSTSLPVSVTTSQPTTSVTTQNSTSVPASVTTSQPSTSVS